MSVELGVPGKARFMRNFWPRKIKTTSPCDVVDRLRSPEEMAAYPDACLEEPDCHAIFVARALGDIPRAQGVLKVASSVGLSGTSQLKVLYEETYPSLDIIFRIISALGLKLCAGVKVDVNVI